MTDLRLDALAARLRRAARLTVLTGAGVSAGSGVPTFRGAGGLWRSFRAEDLATPEAFRRDPALVWEWYAWRREQLGRAAPNPAHHVLARWSHELACQVVTQNVDDLHLQAGTRDLVRLHGSIWEMACSGLAPGGGASGRSCRAAAPWRDERVPLPVVPPVCPSCGALARPAVVWFGEALGDEDVARALEATRCDVFLTVGTSAQVYPAAGLVQEAARRGAFTAEINAEATPASTLVDLAVRAPAEAALPALDQLMAG